jgi:uncharacterized protein involved in type VI secretion and phage assembly
VAREPCPPDEPIRLTYGRNLLELTLSEDLRGRHDPSVAIGWDPANQEAVEADTEAQSVGLDTGNRRTLSAALDDCGLPLHDHTSGVPHALDQAGADLVSRGAARVEALRHITGTAAAIGLPELRIDQWLSVDGVGDRFSGPHYISGVRHRIGQRGGYTTEVQLGLPEPLAPRAAVGYEGGLQIGVVDSLDDPNGWARVKVRFPHLGAALGAVWARLALLDAGNEFGTLFVPEPGQEVVIGFVGDGHADPVVLGSLWNGRSAPPEAVDAGANDVRAIVTRSGHRLRFDDGAATVELASAGGHTVVLDDENGSVEIRDSGGSSIVMGSSGIAITAAQGDLVLAASAGDVKIDAIGIQGSASGPSKIESTATLDITASGTLGLKGALVNIN